MRRGTASWRISEDFLAEPSAFLHGVWAGSHQGVLAEVQELEVLPVSVLAEASDDWVDPDPATVPAISRQWAGRQKMRYHAALRSVGGLEVVRRAGEDCLGPDGSFNYGVVLIEEPWSLHSSQGHLASVGLRLDTIAFDLWLRAAILNRWQI
ncbi:hypothetical protein AB4Z38_25160 [Arthrobacter sp. 2RAF6]|uniref:hypothetical protein n=1 Tax=Arthrobacter sp. 2RAF6 TaxID=3233002 RepID=UPI003F8E7B5D